MAILSTLEPTRNHQMRFKMVHFNIKKTAKSKVDEYQKCNLPTTHSSVLKDSTRGRGVV